MIFKEFLIEEEEDGEVDKPIWTTSLSTMLFDLKQERPVIGKYSETDKSYIIVWEDYRSTGKEFCANLYGQSYSPGSASVGDMNADGTLNVLDVVILVELILSGNE